VGHGMTAEMIRGPRCHGRMALYHEALRTAPVNGAIPNRICLMTLLCSRDGLSLQDHGAR
jgi:hypothetical protein